MNTSAISYPEDWNTHLYDSKITLALTPPSGGWIHLILSGTPRGGLAEVSSSYVFDPLAGLVEWMGIIAKGGTNTMTVDEEGIEVIFSVDSVPERPDWLELHVSRSGDLEDDDDDTPPRTIYHSRVERRQFVHEFYRRFEQWCREDYVPEKWHRFCCKAEEESDKPNLPCCSFLTALSF